MKTIKVEIFSSIGCSKCGRAKDLLRKVVKDFASSQIEWREINILEELDYAMTLGVLSSPAIAIDGKVVFSGLPSARKLRTTLANRLNDQSKRRQE
ncbi:MAG: glutaredoxin [Actinobacteria bacterium]|nr:glutaredoxin [Actinomycetota bacterium]